VSAHTPGPWVCDNGDGPYYGIFAEGNGEPLAYLVEPHRPHDLHILPPDGRDNGAPNAEGGHDYTRSYEHFANARLIAAAPTMAADLALISRACRRLLTPEQCATLSPDEEAAFGRAEKAEARQ
jgi:hypothetical protein